VREGLSRGGDHPSPQQGRPAGGLKKPGVAILLDGALRAAASDLLSGFEEDGVDVLHERCAGIDIGKRDVKACIRVPAGGGRWRTEVQTFSTMTNDLLRLRDWLAAERITAVGMEATGAYVRHEGA
jgi:hypothetical protein